jgi:hypothetical protein
MKYLQSFSVFESQTAGTLTAEQKKFLDQYTKGTWSINPATGLVDVQGTFDCSSRGLKSLWGIRFGMVTGDFWCSNNQLTSLEGAAQTVGNDFNCSHNKLTSLEGAPQTVEGSFYCYSNKLTTLKGAPRTVEGDFYCNDNQLTSLEGSPQTVTRSFNCYNNQITSLEGAPRKVEGYFCCDDFPLNPGQWNLEGWLQVLRTGSSEARKLMSTLPYLDADWWNSQLSKDSARTIQLLVPWWSQMSDDLKRGIKIPPGYEDRFGMRSEFSELGLF